MVKYGVEYGYAGVPAGNTLKELKQGYMVTRSVFGEGGSTPLLSHKTIGGPFKTLEGAEKCLANR